MVKSRRINRVSADLYFCLISCKLLTTKNGFDLMWGKSQRNTILVKWHTKTRIPDQLKCALRNIQVWATWDMPNPVIWHKRCRKGCSHVMKRGTKRNSGLKSMCLCIFRAIRVPQRHFTAHYSTETSIWPLYFFKTSFILSREGMQIRDESESNKIAL